MSGYSKFGAVSQASFSSASTRNWEFLLTKLPVSPSETILISFVCEINGLLVVFESRLAISFRLEKLGDFFL